MPKTIRLKLKPICAEFYSQNDCPYGSQFSATIQHEDTIYKSGVLKPQKQKYLQLQNLSWIQFCIDLSLSNPKVHISLNSHIQNSVKQCLTKNKQLEYQQIRKNIVFQSYLPVAQLLIVPLNKKKRFSFPILCHGEIKAQAEFKVVVKESKQVQSCGYTSKCQLREKQNQNIKYNSQYETAKSVTVQNNKKYPCQPLICQTFVVITPDLFIKKSNSSGSSLTEQSESSRNSAKSNTSSQSSKVKAWRQSSDENKDANVVNNSDLFAKFEKLNRKFADQQIFDKQQNHQSTSVWEIEAQDQNQYESQMFGDHNYYVNKAQIGKNGHLHFGTIRQQIQQGSDNDVTKI